MKPLLSVVVPIYNVEAYLDECVGSLLNQTLKNIEIILVDDGSQDKSGEIADRYGEKHENVKVIHQKNSGLGHARNTGIKAASGDYVGFVDSDDWAEPEMYSRLYDAAVKSKADIVVSGLCEITSGKIVKEERHPLAGQTISGHEQIMSVRKNLYGHARGDKTVQLFPMSACIGIYRTSMLRENNLFFREILSEDLIFNLDVYPYAKVISFTGDTDYRYRKEQQQSITNTFSEKKLHRYIELIDFLFQMANNEEDTECCERARRILIDYTRTYVGVVDSSSLSFSQKKKELKKFAEYKVVRDNWNKYPIRELPVQQMIFQYAMIKGYYGTALILNAVRRLLK